jgi:uncharacterized protein (TIRG00374 family)
MQASGHADAEPRTLRNQLLRPRTALSFLLAAAILTVFFLRTDINLREIGSNIRESDPAYLAGAFAVYYLTLYLRAVRWRWMLAQALTGSESSVPATSYLTAVFTVSWLINCLVPAKLGDAYRAYRVKQDDDIRYSVGFGTIVAERVFDLIILVALLAASGLMAFHGALPGQANTALYLGITMVVAASAGLAVMFFGRERIEPLIPGRFRPHYTNFQKALFDTMGRPVIPGLIGALIWLSEGTRVLLVSKSLGADITIAMAIFVALLSALLTTLPFTPAGLGVVEVAIITALKIGDVPSDMAGSIAILDRVVTYWSLLVVGSIVALIMMRTSAATLERRRAVEERLPSSS